MVSRSTVEALLDMVRIAFGSSMNDEELKAQAIQDPGQTERLIAIEASRARDKRKQTALIGAIALVALFIVVKMAPVVLHAARALKLPVSEIGTTLGTLASTAAVAGLAWWAKRKLNAGRGGPTTPQNPPENRNEGDQNQVGTS
ncbi:hypothetical protein J7I94_27565 [Streptomyces sp. ISL-12]|uniref:hypothetical protein n=1 Tax=Streptomyces sp. ISL-12 TaxID=2819177 RepID=UPI001BEB5191|nr:hypothetical protein [Streptomyces sp. ISL-12]MBT2414262.1 hypothetical protein [Streptomyces sp. ISL-12]